MIDEPLLKEVKKNEIFVFVRKEIKIKGKQLLFEKIKNEVRNEPMKDKRK